MSTLSSVQVDLTFEEPPTMTRSVSKHRESHSYTHSSPRGLCLDIPLLSPPSSTNDSFTRSLPTRPHSLRPTTPPLLGVVPNRVRRWAPHRGRTRTSLEFSYSVGSLEQGRPSFPGPERIRGPHFGDPLCWL